MPKEFNLADFINSLKLSEDEKKVVEAIYAKPENLAEVKRGWNSVSEGSRLADEARQAQTAAEQLAAQVAADKAEAERVKAEASAEMDRTRLWHAKLKEYEIGTQQTKAERDAFEQKQAAYEAYLSEIGIDPALALAGKQIPKVNPVPPPQSGNGNQPAFDETRFNEALASRGLLTAKEVQPAVQLLADLPFDIDAVHQRHLQLFGKPAPNMMELKSKYMNPQNSRTLMDIAAEDFHFAQREQELAEQKLNERAEQLANEKYEKRLSELQLPSAILDRIHSDAPAKFGSDEFAQNVSQSTQTMAATVPDRDMEAFLKLDEQLANQNIRPTA